MRLRGRRRESGGWVKGRGWLCRLSVCVRGDRQLSCCDGPDCSEMSLTASAPCFTSREVRSSIIACDKLVMSKLGMLEVVPTQMTVGQGWKRSSLPPFLERRRVADVGHQPQLLPDSLCPAKLVTRSSSPAEPRMQISPNEKDIAQSVFNTMIRIRFGRPSRLLSSTKQDVLACERCEVPRRSCHSEQCREGGGTDRQCARVSSVLSCYYYYVCKNARATARLGAEAGAFAPSGYPWVATWSPRAAEMCKLLYLAMF